MSLRCLFITLLLVACSSLAAGRDVKRFDIPQQPLSSALLEFSRQSGINVVVEPALVAGKTCRMVRGEMTVDDVLQRLLDGSGLRTQRSSDNTILVEQAQAQDTGSARLQLATANPVRESASGSADDSSTAGTSEDMIVEQTRVKPLTGANLDLPRTTNDAQPYFIFDAVTLQQSGAINIEDFLKQRLTMNTIALTNGQESATNTFGNTSSINLRGVGTDKTLVLVNGRRIAGVVRLGADNQPDINGIPMSAIERIEVLPSSASGIYGGSAIGGVVNIILKRDYAGGEIQASYDNPWEGQAARRTVTASYGRALENGKTHVSLNATWADSSPLILQDRRDMFEHNINHILENVPDFSGLTGSWQGSVPNIYGSSGRGRTNLVLDDGTPLNSQITYLPAGTSASTAPAELAAGLLANAGTWDYRQPPTTQSPTGFLRQFGTSPTNPSLQLQLRRQMLPWLELYANLAYTENDADSIYNPVSTVTVPANAPSNPFRTAAVVRFPHAAAVPATSESNNRAVTIGTMMQLPGNWTGLVDYTWSENRFSYLNYNTDNTALTAALTSGALNPFVDTLLYPLDIGQFLRPTSFSGASQLTNAAIRASGPLPALPWGRPNLTAGLERREAHQPASVYDISYPITTNSSYRYNYFARDSVADAFYMEALIPLLKKDWLPMVHVLELQLSGRTERFEVDTGSAYQLSYPDRNPVPPPSYGSPTLNGEPVFSRASYTSRNYTIAFKYQPIEEVTVRVSRATAFLPPTPNQLIMNPLPSTGTTSVIDPLSGPPAVAVHTLSGGNPGLAPQNSRSLNAGIIWQPTWEGLKGLRLNAEFYRIEQFDAIATLGAQGIVNLESSYPGRVTRDSDGAITLVDNSMINLYQRITEGFDLSADYAMETRLGAFNFRAVQSIIKHLQEQYTLTGPLLEAAGFHPSDSGAPKHKGNISVTWQWRAWNAGWNMRYTGAYMLAGAAGSPFVILNPSLAPTGIYPNYINAQGSDRVSSQTYHDLFVGYAFGRQTGGAAGAGSRVASVLDGVTVQLGVRNIFDQVPPIDTYYTSNYYLSPFGDTRLRSFWLNLKKAF